MLSIVFQRLYTLRNQLIHGGANWNSAVNRDQLRDANGILGDVVPIIIETCWTMQGSIGAMPAIRFADFGRADPSSKWRWMACGSH